MDEKYLKLINWYNSIDKKLLEAQINHLATVAAQLDANSELDFACEGILNMLGDVLTIHEDSIIESNNNVKDEIERDLINLYVHKIGIDIPENHEDITQYVYEYILDVVGVGNYSDQDIAIGFRQWIEKK
jgi:hypothetical protein